jgi:deoxyribonuclease-4
VEYTNIIIDVLRVHFCAFLSIKTADPKGHYMKKTMQAYTFLIGAHISISDGFSGAITQGESIGCTCIQIFTKSNRQWHAKPINPEDAKLFKKKWKDSTISDVIAHSSYLINIGSPDTATAKKSTQALAEELDRCAQLGITYLVLHPGSRLDASPEETLTTIARNLDIALEASDPSTVVLLETMAGQGSTVGANLEQLAAIRKQVTNKKRIGFCVDTCHIFAAGYDFTTKAHYEAFWKHFDDVLGLNHLKAIHLNDSKKEFGSRVDRHEMIGKGKIGTEAFELLCNDPRFFNVVKIVETPKDSLEDDRKNIETLKGLLSKETKKKLGM